MNVCHTRTLGVRCNAAQDEAGRRKGFLALAYWQTRWSGGETRKRATEIKPDPRLNVIESPKADGALGPEMVCRGDLEDAGLKRAGRGRGVMKWTQHHI